MHLWSSATCAFKMHLYVLFLSRDAEKSKGSVTGAFLPLSRQEACGAMRVCYPKNTYAILYVHKKRLCGKRQKNTIKHVVKPKSTAFS